MAYPPQHQIAYMSSAGVNSPGSNAYGPATLNYRGMPAPPGTMPQALPPPPPQQQQQQQQYMQQVAQPPPIANSAPAVVLDAEANRKKLERVLADKETFIRSTKASFRQFDADHSGTLDFYEVRSLIAKLCQNLQLPPVDDETLKGIFVNYDLNGNGQMNLDNFAQLYWRLLHRVKAKYYPAKPLQVRRSFFINRTNLDRNRTIREIFKFTKQLGRGQFGEAWLVIDRNSNLERCCKMINKEKTCKDASAEQIDTEINALKALDHPNVIKIYEVFEDYNNIYIIMELCTGGMLYERLVTAHQKNNTLTEKYVASVMQQIMEALSYIHAQLIVHKDLKPENIMFLGREPNAPIKIVDFGLSELFDINKEFSTAAAGTAYYMAPEVLRRHFDAKCDVWSAGCVMYQLLTGIVPFEGKTFEAVTAKIKGKEPPYERSCQHVSAMAIDLMRRMLTKDPSRRLSAKDTLKHPWFQEAIAKGTKMSVEQALSPEICDNLKKYMKQSGLKNVLVNLMAHNLNLSSQQIIRIGEIFKTLDKDCNGTLSQKELSEGLGQAGVKPHEIVRIVQSLDVDDNSQISYTEFLAACYSWRESELNIVWTAFNKIDQDGDGKITVEEFSRVLLGEGQQQTPLPGQQQQPTPPANGGQKLRSNMLSDREEIKRIISQIDRNHDGVIDWDEFVDFLRNQ